MAAINFPAASESPWYNDKNGITYEYIGGTWRAVNALSNSFDDEYVEVAGDNMTGNLTIGPEGGPEVTLLKNDGSASFAGGDIKLNSDGTALFQYNGNTTGFGLSATVLTSGLSATASLIDNAGNARAMLTAENIVTRDVNGADTFAVNTADGSATFAGDVQMSSQNGGQLAGFRNQIINGDFRVWQRGDSFAAGSDVVRYSADRWENNGITSTVAKAAGFAGFPSAAAVTAASGFSYLVQHIEIDPLADFTQFAPGSTWTLSYWMRDNTSGNPSVDYRGDSAGTNQVVWTPAEAVETIETSGTWTRYARTFTAPTYVQGNHDRVTVYVPASSSSLVLITGVQLEPGPVATPFEHRPIGTELALCQRYYFAAPEGYFYFSGYVQTGSYAIAQSLPVSMRANPTVSNIVRSSVSTANFSTISLSSAGPNYVTLTSTSTGTNADARFVASADIDAEL